MKKILPIALLFVSGLSYSADIKLPIEGVTDGDTIKTSLNLPCPLCTVYVRIRNIDTPETSYLAKCSKERHLGAQAKDYLNFATRNKKTMTVKNVKWDKYGGRIDGHVEIDGVNIGDEMIKRGFAKRYNGTGPKPNWCN